MDVWALKTVLINSLLKIIFSVIHWITYRSYNRLHAAMILFFICRLLQWYFENSTFIVILRHPYASCKWYWDAPPIRQLGEQCLSHRVCNIDTWLETQAIMFRDLRFIRNKIVFHYEHLVLGDPQSL